MTMKVLVAVFCVCAAYVAAEQCWNAADCDFVMCASGHTLACVQRQCTCTDTSQGTCSNYGDCTGACSHLWHCIEGHCRCGFGIGGLGK